VRNLEKSFGGLRVTSDVNLAVEPGERDRSVDEIHARRHRADIAGQQCLLQSALQAHPVGQPGERIVVDGSAGTVASEGR